MLAVLRAHRPHVDVPDDLPLILADVVLLEQVVVNILDHAAKHAPDGTEIFVSAVKRCIGVEMAILDLGPGILPEDQSRCFDMFFRVAGGDRQRAGTGLELTICKGLV